MHDHVGSRLVAEAPHAAAPPLGPAAGVDGSVALPPSLYLRVGKPLLDRSVAVVLIVMLAPIMALVALAVRFRLGRPVLLVQPRVGRGGRVFGVYKFRTMGPDRRHTTVPIAFDDRRRTHKSDADPRHTRLGRFLRATSLDELPQLVNVVRGQMSLVGPRPELVDVVEADGLWEHPRHLLRPGITGPWQLSPARRHRISENTTLDVHYLRSVSLWTDLRLLARTAVVPFRGQGS